MHTPATKHRLLFTIGRKGLNIFIPATSVSRSVTMGISASSAGICILGKREHFIRFYGVWFRKPADSKRRLVIARAGA